MLINDFNQLPPAAEAAVIINVSTKFVTTLALLSTLRYVQIPTIVLDCESRDGSYDWFKDLLRRHDFHLIPAELRPHGQTLDWVFKNIQAERVLLVDSDV